MKKLILTLIIIASFSAAPADQLAYITKDQAEKAAEFLKKEREVLLYCGCCDNDPATYITVTGISVKFTGYENYYEVIITGRKNSGEELTVEADLAYVHVKRNGLAVAAGKILGFECDPCVDKLKWDSDIR